MIALTREPSGKRASTIGETVVDAPTDAADDAVDDAHQVRSSRNCAVASRTTAALDEHVLVGVHQNVADRRIRQQRLQRPQPKHFVQDFRRKPLSFLQVHRRHFTDDKRFQNLRHFTPYVFAVYVRQPVQVHLRNQLAMNCCFNGAKVRSPVRGSGIVDMSY